MAEIVPLVQTTDLSTFEERLKRVFVARYGLDVGMEVTAEAMAWAWANRDSLAEADNPLGLLYRVGQSRSRRYLRWRRQAGRALRFPPERTGDHDRWIHTVRSRVHRGLARLRTSLGIQDD